MGDRPISTIFSVGTELTEGTILNTHFRFLGAELRGLGFFTRKAVQIPDDPDIFREELREAVRASGLVIVTGGLGPTSDDLTRETIAEVCAAPLRFDQAIWDDLVQRYAARGRSIAQTNRKQAQIPSGFRVLNNRVGSAPGFCGVDGACTVMALPGPPAELEEMFLREALPLLQTRFFSSRGAAVELVATAIMIPESVLEQALQEARGSDAAPRWSTRVAEDRIVWTLRGSQRRRQRRVYSALLKRFGPLRIREGDVQPSFLPYRILSQRRETVAVAES